MTLVDREATAQTQRRCDGSVRRLRDCNKFGTGKFLYISFSIFTHYEGTMEKNLESLSFLRVEIAHGVDGEWRL